MIPSATFKEVLCESALLLKEAMVETIWPTRCVICDLPGTLLCTRCRVQLPYIDQLKVCPTCGSAYGKQICCECNQFILTWKHLDSFPLNGCVSVVDLTSDTRRIVTCYKDKGERRLACLLARALASCIPPAWLPDAALIPIPSRHRALKERGFDHIELIAQELHNITNLPLVPALQTRAQKDQRRLSGQERLTHAKESFYAIPETLETATRNLCNTSEQAIHQRLILVDDVMTTGSTLFAAAEALRSTQAANLSHISGLTFARA